MTGVQTCALPISSLLTDARTALPTVSFTSSFGVSYIDFLMVEFLLFLFCKFVSQNTMIPLNISTQPVLIAWRTSFVNWSGSKSIRASWGYELAIIYPTSPVWCRIIVDGGGRGQGKVRRQLLTPSFPLWYKFLSLPSVLLPLKSRVAAIIFFKKIPSTRSPKLRLLCRLQESRRKCNNLYKNINNLHKE